MQYRFPASDRWRPLILGLLTLLGVLPGCTTFRDHNTAAYIERDIRASDDSKAAVMFKAAVLVPVRDILLLDPLWRRVFGSPAWNTVDGNVPDGSFYTNRTAKELSPASVARGPCLDPPQPPFTILRRTGSPERPGFLGRDDAGRKYFFKLDHVAHPGLGTSATIIGSRLLWALGYNVSAEHLVQVDGTGDPALDGQRATASALIEDVRGHFHFDWFRHRRELRGLRLACAWINDVDRIGSNTLVAIRDGRAHYYLIDFDSCLGAWQGQPKPAWRGWRPAGSVGWALLRVLTIGHAHAAPDPHQPIVSPAVGRFEATHFRPLDWECQAQNNAFEHLTPADTRWICARIGQLGREHIEAVVAAAKLDDPHDAAYLVQTLLERQAKILALKPTEE